MKKTYKNSVFHQDLNEEDIVEPRSKNPALLSIESWLFKDGILLVVGTLNIIHT